MTRIVLLIAVLSCHTSSIARHNAPSPVRSPVSARVASIAFCTTVEQFGAIASDGQDDTVALQSMNDQCGFIVLGDGNYDVVTPSAPRRRVMLRLTGELVGTGASRSRVVFSGDNAGLDWTGIWMASSASRVHFVTLDASRITAGSTTEQSPVIRANGPLTELTIEDTVFNNPVVVGSPRGDCVQLVGYPTSEITDVVIQRVDFVSCARSGVAMHSGVRRYAILDSVFRDTRGQDIDQEGTGDLTDGVVARNTMVTGADQASSIAISVMLATGLHIHNNTLDGRGIDLYGCSDCELDHNVVTQSVLSKAGSVVYVRKASIGVSMHDETYTRTNAAGSGGVLSISQKGSGSPANVSVLDSLLAMQDATGTVAYVGGVVGFSMLRSRIQYSGSGGQIGLSLAGGPTTRTTGVVLDQLTMTGPLRYSIYMAGSANLAGVGDASVTGVTTSAALRCDNVSVGSGITGPVVYSGNQMPAPIGCKGLIP